MRTQLKVPFNRPRFVRRANRKLHNDNDDEDDDDDNDDDDNDDSDDADMPMIMMTTVMMAMMLMSTTTTTMIPMMMMVMRIWYIINKLLSIVFSACQCFLISGSLNYFIMAGTTFNTTSRGNH